MKSCTSSLDTKISMFGPNLGLPLSKPSPSNGLHFDTKSKNKVMLQDSKWSKNGSSHPLLKDASFSRVPLGLNILKSVSRHLYKHTGTKISW